MSRPKNPGRKTYGRKITESKGVFVCKQQVSLFGEIRTSQKGGRQCLEIYCPLQIGYYIAHLITLSTGLGILRDRSKYTGKVESKDCYIFVSFFRTIIKKNIYVVRQLLRYFISR